jgi:hypothetical protein
VIFLSGLAPPSGSCRGGDLRGLYSALSQDSMLVVEDFPLVVWGLCFGKVGGGISCRVGPVWGYSRTGPQCLPTPPFSASSNYAAIVCIGSGCYIWSISPVLSSVLCEFKYAPSNSLSLFLLSEAVGPCLKTTWPGDSLLSPVHLVVLLLQCHLFCLRLWNPDLFTRRATLSRTCCFRLLFDPAGHL